MLKTTVNLGTVCGLLLLLGACSLDRNTWNTSSWFGTGQNEDDGAKFATPGFGKQPLTAPKAAPALPVQKATLPPQPTSALAAEAMSNEVISTTETAASPTAAPTIQSPNAGSTTESGGEKTRIALLLPLSGANQALGQSMLNAAQMAVFDVAPGNFELLPRDTAGKGGADMAARDAIGSGAQMIIGPLFAMDVPAVKTVALAAHIPVVALSSDSTVREASLYVAGFTPEAQINRIVGYAIKHGIKRFAALVPGTSYGTLVARVMQNAATAMGGNLVALEVYDPAKHDSAAHAQTLGMLKKQIDAVLVPETGANLALIASQLVAAGFSPETTHILGTGLWDDAGVGQLNPALVGGWYAAPDHSLRRTFVANYKAAYGQEPVRLATLAYDCTALAAALAKHGLRSFDEASLTNPNGFAGLDGIFRLSRDGAVERGLAVHQVTASGATTIDPAPITFAK